MLFEAAAQMLGVQPDQLEARDRKIQVKGYPQRISPSARWRATRKS